MNWVIIDLFCKRLEPFLGQENLEVVSDIVHTASAWVSLLFIYDRMGNKISTSQPQTSIFIHAISWRDGWFQVSLITWNESNTAAWHRLRGPAVTWHNTCLAQTLQIQSEASSVWLLISLMLNHVGTTLFSNSLPLFRKHSCACSASYIQMSKHALT